MHGEIGQREKRACCGRPAGLCDGNLASQLLASRVAARPAVQRALAASHHPVAATRGRLRDQGCRAGVADLGAAHGDGGGLRVLVSKMLLSVFRWRELGGHTL